MRRDGLARGADAEEIQWATGAPPWTLWRGRSWWDQARGHGAGDGRACPLSRADRSCIWPGDCTCATAEALARLQVRTLGDQGYDSIAGGSRTVREGPGCHPVRLCIIKLLTSKILAVFHESAVGHRQVFDFLDSVIGSLPSEIDAATNDAATGRDRRWSRPASRDL